MRNRLARAWLVGALPVLLLTAWMITGGRWDFLQTMNNEGYFLDRIYDAQARAILDGRLDVTGDMPPGDDIQRGGKSYVYFGIFPALLRIPILVVTDSLDGRLATLSMLTATCVLTVASARLCWLMRVALRGRSSVTRSEVLGTIGLAAAVISGPPLLLAAGIYIYHEAVLWGLALSVASFDAIARWHQEPTKRRLAVASALTAMAMLSRQSVAIGPLVALGLVGATQLLHLWRDRAASGRHLRLASIRLLVAGLVPVLLSTGFHYPRTGQLFGLDAQRITWLRDLWNPEIAEHHKMGPKHLPLTISTYLRPVGIELRSSFPWVDFPLSALHASQARTPVHSIDWTPSLPSVSPALVVLALAGGIWTIHLWRRRMHRTLLPPLVLGSIAGSIGVLLYFGASGRYLGDIYPVAVVGGIIGFHALVPWHSTLSQWARAATMATFGTLVLGGALVTTALTIELQRERWYAVPASWRSEFLSWRMHLPGSPDVTFIRADQPFPPATEGTLLVVGDCPDRYVANEGKWVRVEGSTRSLPTEAMPSSARQCFT